VIGEEKGAVDVLVGGELRDVAGGKKYVWAATEKGVNRFDRETGKWYFFTAADGLADNSVNCIAVELKEGILRSVPSGRIWFGTDAGVSLYDTETDAWISYTSQDGLLEDKVTSIFAYGSNVWFGTAKGASIYNKSKHKWISFPSFEGLSSNEVTCIYQDQNYVWIGTKGGLARYNQRYKKWEYFSSAGSVWYAFDGTERKSPDCPIPADTIHSIDGEGDGVYVATGRGLVKYDKSIPRDAQRARVAYKSRHRSRNRREFWEVMGWQYRQFSTFAVTVRLSAAANFLVVRATPGRIWAGTNSGLAMLDSWMGAGRIFTAEDGLIDNEVTALAIVGQEVWAGTPHGLTRYNLDAQTWENFRIERALPSSYVTAVAADYKYAWFATRNALSRFEWEGENWRTFTRSDGMAGSSIRSIELVGNYVWLGTDEGVSRLDKSSVTVSSSNWDNFKANKTGLPSDEVTAIVVDGKYIWVGTKAGLSRYDDTTGEWKTFRLSDDKPTADEISSYITTLTVDPKCLWVGTKAGIRKYDKGQGVWDTFKVSDNMAGNVITDVDVDEKRVWAGTKGGLSILDKETGDWTEFTVEDGLPKNVINALALDGKGVWLAYRGGICYFTLETGKPKCKIFTDDDVEGLSRVSVKDVDNTEPYVWFATDGGIYRYNKLDGAWWVYSPTKQGSRDVLVDANVQTIAGDEEFMYFGTPAGISKYDKITQNWLNYVPPASGLPAEGLINSNVHALLVDGIDLWVGTDAGISRYDAVSDMWTGYMGKEGLSDETVFSLAADDEAIWAGTRKGASRFDKKTSKWTTLSKADGLPDDHIWAVMVDGTDIWFGTDAGVARKNSAFVSHEGIHPLKTETNEWTTFTVSDGLINNKVLSIGVEGKYVFFTTPSGVSIYDKEIGSFSPLKKSDGLAGAKVKAVDTVQDYAWFGTSGGATLYDEVTDRGKAFTERDGLAGNNVQSLLVDRDIVWFGTDSGLSRYDVLNDRWLTYNKVPAVETKESLVTGLSSYNIKSVASGPTYVWVGTRIGLSRYDKLGDKWEEIPLETVGFDEVSATLYDISIQTLAERISPSSGGTSAVRASIRVIAESNRYLWLGSDNGLFMFDKSANGTVAFFQFLNGIRDIEIGTKRLWVLCANKLAVFEPHRTWASWQVFSGSSYTDYVADGRHFASPTKSVEEHIGLVDCTSLGIIGDCAYIGRERGLLVYNINDKKPAEDVNIPEELTRKKITVVLVDGDSVWVGTREGLHRYDTVGGFWKTFTEKDGLASNRVSSITADSQYIWVGSSNRGVSRYDTSTESWDVFTSRDGLSDDNIRDIAIDGRYIWFGTFSGGVCRYDKNSDLWTNFKAEDWGKELAKKETGD